MTLDYYPTGIDCVWLAIDGEQHVAAFVTAGEGPLPTNLLPLDEAGDDDVESWILELPVVSALRESSPNAEPTSFNAIAERGFFVYDWTDVHRNFSQQKNAYELVATPLQPISVEALPSRLVASASKNRVPTERFGKALLLDICHSLDCVKAT